MKLHRTVPSALFAGVFAFAVTPFVARADEHPVSSATEISDALQRAQPGDTLVMREGVWTDQSVVFRAKGTTDKPITLRAATPGKVILAGRSSVVIDGEHLVATGLFLKNGESTGDGVKVAGSNNRLTQCEIAGGSYKFFIHLFGKSNRVDHCYVAGKTNDNPTLQVEVEGGHNYHRIDHNHFGPRPPLGHNGGETIRVGYSHQSMTNSGTLVESNLFEACDGELEIISNKSCENIYRANTFLDCAGMLTLRHGNRCTVERNLFLGHHKRGSGGIRVIGEDHVVVNNTIDSVTQGGIWITAGIPNSELKGYFQARNCLIAFNTIVDSAGPCLQLDAGLGTSGRTLRPEKITIATNVLCAGKGGTLLKGIEGVDWRWLGNITTPTTPVHPEGIRSLTLELSRDRNGLLRPVKGDSLESGLHSQFGSTAAVPLTSRDVGPDWSEHNASRSQP